MKKVCRSFFTCLLFCVTVGACQRQGEEPRHHEEERAIKAVTLTSEQLSTIGLQTVRAVVQEVRPGIASFGRVIPRPQGRVQVTSPVAGQVTQQSGELIPSPGSFVQKGQLLAEVQQTYSASERVQLAVGEKGAAGATHEAKAALEAAKAEYQRSQNLFQAKIISRKRLEEAKTAWLQAQSRYETARRQEASYHTTTPGGGNPQRFPLTAPIAGVVIQADVTARQQVETTMLLFTIVDLSTVWVEAPIFEGDLDRIDRDRPALIYSVGSVGDESAVWIGKPMYAGEVVDPVKRTVSFQYEVDNSGGQLKLGMSVTVDLPTGPTHPVVLVPEAALIADEGGKGLIYIRRSPTLFAQEEVNIGTRYDNLVAVEGAVNGGEEVVAVGAQELFGQANYLPVREEE